ncbi:unnamed protein product [marine sediment metagenome]|uniref:Uncharacterized protein n=1 Tax=marine sediment metagenome TaxID=412755 RepID=X1HM87_9ZZZZ
MNEGRSNLTITHKYDLEYPEMEEAYLVPKSDWNRLRKRIERIKPPPTLFLTIGSVLLGVAATAFIGVLTLPDINGYKPLVCWAVFAVASVCGGFSLFFYRRERTRYTSANTDIIEYIDEINEKYPKHTDTSV